MTGHNIEREAVIWAGRALRWQPSDDVIDGLVADVLSGRETHPVVQIAIAYVEAAKNHIDVVLELETNLETVTAERDELRGLFSNSYLDKLKQENARLSAELKELRFRMDGLEK